MNPTRQAKALGRRILAAVGLEPVARLLVLESAAKEDGWFQSVRKKQAVDRDGNPLPWVTYPFIDFIEGRLDATQEVFEFGAGNSSLFFAKRVKSVLSVEHHPEWFQQISTSPEYAMSNLEVKMVPVPEGLTHDGYHSLAFTDATNDYVLALKNSGRRFDIVIVDGLFRNSCIENCLESLTSRGVVFLDNTSHHYVEQLQSGLDFMKDAGFRRLDFHGMGPIYSRKSCTSIFYREGNCLGI